MKNKSKLSDCIAGGFLGIGFAMGFFPILIASLIIQHNLFLEMIERMDSFWKERQI
jgi:hypothetical protein